MVDHGTIATDECVTGFAIEAQLFALMLQTPQTDTLLRRMQLLQQQQRPNIDVAGVRSPHASHTFALALKSLMVIRSCDLVSRLRRWNRAHS